MSRNRMFLISSSALALSVLGVSFAALAGPVSDADKAFVAKVSQGGMYEVKLGTVAESQGSTQDIKDQGNTESHDHEIVGGTLKSIAKSAGLPFPSELNSEFKARLEKISALSGKAFDSAYIDDMKKIHAADGAAFLKETQDGMNSDLKSFAAETYNIVQRHIGELDAHTRPQAMLTH